MILYKLLNVCLNKLCIAAIVLVDRRLFFLTMIPCLSVQGVPCHGLTISEVVSFLRRTKLLHSGAALYILLHHWFRKLLHVHHIFPSIGALTRLKESFSSRAYIDNLRSQSTCRNKEPRRILLQSIFGTDKQKKKRFTSTMSTKRKRWPIERNWLRQVLRVDGTPWCKGPEYIRKCLDGVRLESFSFSRHQKEG